MADPTGAAWHDMPEPDGPGNRVYVLFLRWQRDETWARFLTQLQASGDTPGA
ncbi:hypothetical protein [Streptomyces sp. NPDC093094]|uniref:hypothetical protein n=1 Tax=Streptomyces sp. NPDC093094 TaxID=3366026 RepID=UPI003824AEC9